jgi:hypothetical protein
MQIKNTLKNKLKIALLGGTLIGSSGCVAGKGSVYELKNPMENEIVCGELEDNEVCMSNLNGEVYYGFNYSSGDEACESIGQVCTDLKYKKDGIWSCKDTMNCNRNVSKITNALDQYKAICEKKDL